MLRPIASAQGVICVKIEAVPNKDKVEKDKVESVPARALRADAQRNVAAVIEAAKAVFKTAGVDAPVRDIAARAGVGMGTLYRHFPQRADLIAAVFRNEVDACAAAAPALAAQHRPGEALAQWMQRYADFISTKRGLAAALHSGDPAFDVLPVYFDKHLRPALQNLLEAAVAAGEVRDDVDPGDLLSAVGSLGMRMSAGSSAQTHRMVALLVDGLRFGAGTSTHHTE